MNKPKVDIHSPNTHTGGHKAGHGDAADTTVHKRTDIPDGEGPHLDESAIGLKNQLLKEQVAAMFDSSSGALKPEFIARSMEIPLRHGIENPKVIARLTSDGSNINDWGKFTTKTVNAGGAPESKLDSPDSSPSDYDSVTDRSTAYISEEFDNLKEKVHSIADDISIHPLDKMSSDALKYFNSHIRIIDYKTDESGYLQPVRLKDVYNNDVDAFRHAYASGVITMHFGESAANLLGEGVEMLGGLRDSFKKAFHISTTDPEQYVREKNMDLWNNRVGREIALNSVTKAAFVRNLAEALKTGKLIINPTTDMRAH